MIKNYIIPIFLPRYGCKYRCIFCSQEHIVTNEYLDLNITKKINEYLATIRNKNKKVELAFYGGTFTGLDFSIQEKLLKQVKPFIDDKLINGIRISTRPDCLSGLQIDLLENYHINIVELGVQSLNNEVLEKCERGHTKEDVLKATADLRKKNIKVSYQMMVGLPGENLYRLKQSAKLLRELSPDFIRIHPTIVLKGSKLEILFRENKYIPLTLRQAINRCILYLNELKGSEIKVIRLGLYPSLEIRNPGVIVAGPFHPAFRDLVDGEIFYKLIKSKLNKCNYKGSTLEIKTLPKYASVVRGQRLCNIEKIKKRYMFDKINVITVEEKMNEGIEVNII